MDLVGYEVDPEIDCACPEKWRAWTRATTTGGATHTQWVDVECSAQGCGRE